MNKKIGKLLILIAIVLIVIGIVIMVYQKIITTDNDNSKDKDDGFKTEDKDRIKIKDGTLPLCSAENLTEYDYEDNNNNIIFTNINYITDKDENRLNNSSLLKESHNYQGIIVDNATITSQKCNEKFAKLSVRITNNSGKDIENTILNFNFIGNNSEYNNVVSLLVLSLKNNQTIDLSEEFSVRIIDAKDYTLSINDSHLNAVG